MFDLSTELAKPPEELAREFSKLRTRQDVARLLEVPDRLLIYYIYRLPTRLRYKVFSIPKKTGGVRYISAPDSSLKIIQHKLNQVLSAVYHPKASSQGFIRGRSIVSNAAPHRRMRYVFNIDIENFFPSINFGRVRGLFIAKPYNLPPRVATVLAQICCHNNQLPQGAATSPVVSNMICARLDSGLQKFAKRHYSTYTRYADDITFSKTSHVFPPEICKISSAGSALPGDELRKLIELNGFVINASKVRLQSNKIRQSVTGLVVNKKLNVDRKYVRQIRAMIHAWDKHGFDRAQKYFAEKFDKPYRRLKGKSPSLKNVIRGKLEFIRMVKGSNDAVYKNLQKRLAVVDPAYLEYMMKANAKAEMRDVFISHASEDKATFVRPLAKELVKIGCKVWYDEYELQLGDSLRAKIDDGLSRSRFGLVVLSKHFFAKKWPRIELDGLTAREVGGKAVIIAVWHDLTHDEVAEYSPTLAGKLGLVSRGKSIPEVASMLHSRFRI